MVLKTRSEKKAVPKNLQRRFELGRILSLYYLHGKRVLKGACHGSQKEKKSIVCLWRPSLLLL